MKMYRVSENKNGKIILLALFKYRKDAAKYIIDELYEPLSESVDYGYIEIENNYNIDEVDIDLLGKEEI